MILKGNEDPRVQKTIKAIKENFYELILEKDYSKITVTELCSRAQINKKTFYTYYETLDALLLEMQSTISAEYNQRIKGLSLKNIDELIRQFFLFSEEQGPFYEKITCGGSYAEIRNQMIKKVNDSSNLFPELEKLTQAEQEIIKTFITDSLLSIYQKWISSGKKLAVEDIISLTTKLITAGINQYITH